MLAELKDQMRELSTRLIESNSETRKQMGNLQNSLSKELEKLTASIRKQLEFHTNITGHAESDAPRYCLLGYIIPFVFRAVQILPSFQIIGCLIFFTLNLTTRLI